MVLPFTDDPTLLEMYVASLSTAIMPVPGKEPSRALVLAEEMLSRNDIAGTILFLTDGIEQKHIPAFIEHKEENRDQVLVLALGTREGGPIRISDNRFLTERGKRVIARLDDEALRAVSAQADVSVAGVTVDNGDIERLQRRMQNHLQAVQSEDDSMRWRDFGYFLTFPIALLTLLWFRKGWTVQWVPLLLLLLLPGCTTAGDGFRFIDLWMTRDQQGRYYYEQGDYETAAERFRDAMWKATAYYHAGDFDSAVDWFVRLESAESYYNLGNCYAMLGSYEPAVQSYDDALVISPDWQEAHDNRELVSELIERAKEQKDDDAPPGEPSFEADEVKFDEKGDKGKEGEVPMEIMTEEQISELWLRRLQTSPAMFLRQKFALQAEKARQR
jgi:Ca-activated chloride channel family protein